MRRIVPIGPYHPLQEEPEFFKLIVEGERVVGLEITIGYNHRGHELLCQKRTYDQVPYVVERICGICSNSHPAAYVLAVEDLAGIAVPRRAQYIRTVIDELQRLHSHLLWLGLAGHFVGYNTVWMWAWRYREAVNDIFELVAGNRQHYACNRIGGVRYDIADEDRPRIEQALTVVENKVRMFAGAVLDDPVLRARLEHVGVLSRDAAVAYGVVGPTARASGVRIDVRKDDPYFAYDGLAFDLIAFEEGDVLAKAKVRLLECFESVKIIRQCLAAMEPGPIQAEVDEIPPGEGIGRAEAPRGEVFHYVRSDGSNMPVRHKIRAPSYVNIFSNEVAVVGGTIADAALTLAAVDPCYCCTERMAAFQDGRRVYGYQELLALSWRKTEQVRARYHG